MKKQKPPIGLFPRKLHEEDRYKKVSDAILRRISAGLEVSEDWLQEYNELVVKMEFKEEEDGELIIHDHPLKPSESAKLNRGESLNEESEWTPKKHRENLLFAIRNDFGPGCEAICKERARQKEVKNFHVHRDEQLYKNEQLAQAAVSYALHPNHLYLEENHTDRMSQFWPWDQKYWKPTPEDRYTEFKKAGALLAAQIDVTIAQKSEGRN